MAMQPRRRARKVHHLHLHDIQGLEPQQLAEMLREGTVEIIVKAKDGNAWGEILGRFFTKLEENVDGWQDHMRNRTVIVNFVDPG